MLPVDPPYAVALAELETRSPHRSASLLLQMITMAGPVTVVQDAGSGQFLIPPDVQPTSDADVVALSPDGTQVLLIEQHGDVRRIGRYDVGAGWVGWVPLSAPAWVCRAATMADRRTAVVLAETWDEPQEVDTEGTIAITAVNLDTGQHDTLYSAAGSLVAESTIAVSPDGQYIAATYNADAPADDVNESYSHAVVVDLRGRLVLHRRGAEIVPQGNTGWLNRSHVACECLDADGMPAPVFDAIDVFSGERRPLRSSRRRPVARLGDRFLFQVGTPAGEGPRLETGALDGEDWRPFLAIQEPSLIMRVDAAIASA